MPLARIRSLLILLSFALLAACGKPAPTPQATAVPAPTSSPTPMPPTATATPAPPTAALLIAPQTDAGLAEAARQWLQALARQKGYRMVVLKGNAALPPHTVVALGVGIVPAKAPHARRLVVSPPQNAALEGVQTVDAAPADLPHRAFLAGYLAVVITKDWRAGFLVGKQEQAAASAFEDGGRYFCGMCRPLYPPFQVYPQYALVPQNANAQARQAALAPLIRDGVKTLAVSPAAWNADILSALPKSEHLIALGAIPQEARPRFAAVIFPDLAAALTALWQHPQQSTATLPMRVDVFDHELITPGRLRLAEEVRQALQAGAIRP